MAVLRKGYGVLSFDTIPSRIFLTTLGVGFAAIATIVGIVFFITAATDRLARDDSRRQVQIMLDAKRSQTALLVADYGHWETPYHAYFARDAEVLYDMLGSGAAEGDGFDFLYLTDADGQARYAYLADVYESDLSVVDPALAAALSLAVGQTQIASMAVVSAFARMKDGIAVVAASRILPDDLTDLDPDKVPLIMGGIFLDDLQIAQMQQQLLLTNLHVRAHDPDRGPDRGPDGGPERGPERSADFTDSLAQSPLRGIDNTIVGQIAWQPQTPGAALRQRTLPAISALALLILTATWFVASAASQQFRAYLNEHSNARADGLTGLTNRLGLTELMGKARLKAALTEGRLAVVYIDLNGFKRINDTHGHEAGDHALRITAKRLRAAVRKGDYIVRMGGDEFLCLLVDNNPLAAAHEVATRIVESSKIPIQLAGSSYQVRAAIGITIAGTDAYFADLLTRADRAMYLAKDRKSLTPVVCPDELGIPA